MKTWLRRVIATSAVALTAATLTVGAASATTFQLTPHDGTIWAVDGSSARPISYAEWTADGRPAPSLAPVDYVGHYWSTGIWARTTWASPAPSSALVTFDQWVDAGRPSARHIPWIDGTYVYRWATSDQVGVVDPSGDYHWLTAAEWAAAGRPTPDVRENQGFAKLFWSNEIARMTNLSAGQGHPIGGATWEAENRPVPLEVTRFAGDQFYREAGSSTIRYAGPTMNRAITLGEWHAAGSPAPQVIGTEIEGVSASTWAALAQCESGGDPRIVSSNGLYHGLYQFTTSTWRSVGGSGLPSQASPEEQTERASILQARSGWGQWPACSRKLGLR